MDCGDIKHFTKVNSNLKRLKSTWSHLKNLHMSCLMGYNKGRREAVFMIEGAAADRVAHPGDRGIS